MKFKRIGCDFFKTLQSLLNPKKKSFFFLLILRTCFGIEGYKVEENYIYKILSVLIKFEYTVTKFMPKIIMLSLFLYVLHKTRLITRAIIITLAKNDINFNQQMNKPE